MAKKTELEIEIDDKGDVKVHVKGIKGKGCLEYLEIFQTVLGEVVKKDLTPEYYEEEVHVKKHIKGKVQK
jgi:hypothetical protein